MLNKEENIKNNNVNDGAKQREEIHKRIWDVANSLRGSIDGWDFKVYVLTIMFYKYLSQKLVNSLKKDEDVDYSTMSDEEALVYKNDIISNYGFFMLPSELFENLLRKAPTDPNLNKDLKKFLKILKITLKIAKLILISKVCFKILISIN